MFNVLSKSQTLFLLKWVEGKWAALNECGNFKIYYFLVEITINKSGEVDIVKRHENKPFYLVGCCTTMGPEKIVSSNVDEPTLFN